jgi:hypothetical protein
LTCTLECGDERIELKGAANVYAMTNGFAIVIAKLDDRPDGLSKGTLSLSPLLVRAACFDKGVSSSLDANDDERIKQ